MVEFPERGIGESGLDDEKIAIQFITREDRIKGTGLFFLIDIKDGYVGNLGKGKFIISIHLAKYLREKEVGFKIISLPPKLRDAQTS